jgi:hypothetical protein
MTDGLKLETKVIRRFIIKTKQDRYIGFISDKKNRSKFTNSLAHFSRDLNKDLFEEIKGDERQVIRERLKSLGKINDCYLISESNYLDQKRFDVETALIETIGHGMGTLIVFGDARLVYYEAEGPKDRWISKILD